MNKFIVIFVLSCLIALCFGRPASQQESNSVSSTAGAPFNEEIIVESSLNIRNKPKSRQRRQFGPQFGGPYGQSSALANANSFGQYAGPQGFGSSAGIAGAQAFRSQGPYGGFGANAANAGTQGFNCGPGGCSGSAGMSGSQGYDLPGGRHVNIGYGGTFSGGSNAPPTYGNSNSISFT